MVTWLARPVRRPGGRRRRLVPGDRRGDLYPSYPGLVVVMLQRRSDEIGDAVGAYLDALAAGRSWLADHPDHGVEALMATGLTHGAARMQLACAVPAR